MKGNVHALISTCVWIYLIEFGPDGTGPLRLHCMLPAIVMLHVLSIQNNQIEMQLCGSTVYDIYVKLQPFELS